MMIELRIISKSPPFFISAKELYDLLHNNEKKYYRWLNKNIIDNFSLEEKKDYVRVESEKENPAKRGPARLETYLTPRIAASLCVVRGSAKAKEVKTWLENIFVF